MTNKMGIKQTTGSLTAKYLPPLIPHTPSALISYITHAMAQPTKVIIVGAGIAGPVLALFLKRAGYAPVIYERTQNITDAGLSLWYTS